MTRRFACLAVLALLPILVAAGGARAAPPARQEQLVYGGNVWHGSGFASTFYPQPVKTIYLLSGQPSILTARQTLVYYWPIDNQYRADWESLNRVVTGTLEIAGGGAKYLVEQTSYVIQYPQGTGAAPMLYTGPEATAQYQAFQQARATFNDAVSAYQEAARAYQVALDEATQRRARGESVALPVEPTPPDDFVWLSTPPNPGFAIDLAPGAYSVRLMAGGQPVAGSERRLVVFAPRRTGVSYTLVPESRWTEADRSDAPEQVVYAQDGSIIYLQPMEAILVNDLAYERLLEPQTRAGRANRWLWVHTWPLSGLTLLVRSGGQERRIDMQPYSVRQLPGAALGYQVIPFDPGQQQTPDIVGYRLQAAAGSFHLVDENGAMAPGSERVMRPPRRVSDIAFASLALLPLAAGGLVVTSRRQKAVQPSTIKQRGQQ